MQLTKIPISSIYKKVGVKGLSKRTNLKRTKATIKRIKPYIKKKDKILDLGCGYGRITIPLQNKGYNVYGVDISKNLLEYAKKRSNYSNIFKVGSIHKLPYKSNSFDKIICLWSVWNEVLSNHKKCLDEMHRVLKKDGLIVIDIINSDTLFMKLVLFISRFFYKIKNPHIWTTNIKHNNKYYIVQYFLYNRKYLISLLKKSKFSNFYFRKHNICGRNRLFVVLKK
jgi:ubiquinone/menaquinone biosynthesis C-methylase UbiE